MRLIDAHPLFYNGQAFTVFVIALELIGWH